MDLLVSRLAEDLLFSMLAEDFLISQEGLCSMQLVSSSRNSHCITTKYFVTLKNSELEGTWREPTVTTL